MNKKVVNIKVKNLRLRTIIGINSEEKKNKQDVIVNYSFNYNIKNNNDVNNIVVNYKTITKYIIGLVENFEYLLLEDLTEEIYKYLSQNIYLNNICVKISKPYALRFSDDVICKIKQKNRKNTYIIGIGSNIESELNVKKAKQKIIKIGKIIKATNFITTKPLKFTEQNDFLNGALLLKSKYSFFNIQKKLKKIEKSLGRVKTSNKNGPRIIDLDILTYNKKIIDNEVNNISFLQQFVSELNNYDD